MRCAVALAVLSGLLFPGCEEANLCKVDPADPRCQIVFKPVAPFDKRMGAEVNVESVKGEPECLPFSVSLAQGEGTRAAPLEPKCARLNDEMGRLVSVSIPHTLSKTYRIGPSELQLLGRSDGALLHKIPLKWVLPIAPYVSPTAPMQNATNASLIPRAEFVGMQDGILYVASSGYAGANKLWTVDKYRYQSSPASLFKLPIDYLRASINLPADRLLLAMAGGMPEGSAYLSHKPEDYSLALTVCPVRDANVKNTDCQSDTQMSLPTGTQAMVVSADRSRIARADANGALSWAPISPPVAIGVWNSIATAGAGVRLAMTDLNADGKSDVVAVWGATGSQKAAAYLATDVGYTQDPTVSKQLTDAIGSQAITALAAGDVDRDGYGDVVFAQKQMLVVLQSQLDKFEPVWSTIVDPDMVKTQIDAIAVGRLEPGVADDKQLDIVTASNTAYDAMNNLTMYLHAFRPMP